MALAFDPEHRLESGPTGGGDRDGPLPSGALHPAGAKEGSGDRRGQSASQVGTAVGPVQAWVGEPPATVPCDIRVDAERGETIGPLGGHLEAVGADGQPPPVDERGEYSHAETPGQVVEAGVGEVAVAALGGGGDQPAGGQGGQVLARRRGADPGHPSQLPGGEGPPVEEGADGLVELYTDDATLESPLVPRILEQPDGVLRGSDQLRRFSTEGGRRRPNPLVRWHRDGGFLSDRTTLAWEYPRDAPDGDQVDIAEIMVLADGRIVAHRIYWGWYGTEMLIASAVGNATTPPTDDRAH